MVLLSDTLLSHDVVALLGGAEIRPHTENNALLVLSTLWVDRKRSIKKRAVERTKKMWLDTLQYMFLPLPLNALGKLKLIQPGVDSNTIVAVHP